MIIKTKILSILFISIFTIFISLNIFLSFTNSISKESMEIKNQFTKIVQLPDLSFWTEDIYLRHRSLSDIFSIYHLDSSLSEYSLGTFAYSFKIIPKSKYDKK